MAKIFVSADGSQAEARVVAWKGPVPKLKQWFIDKVDVHLSLTRLISEHVHKYNVKLPNNMYLRKLPLEYTKEDEERQTSKNCVHANNYEVGKRKFAAMCGGIPESVAETLQVMYFSILPEIKTGYQRKIREAIQRNATIVIPPPFNWKRTFYSYTFGTYKDVDDEVYRKAYAFYAQTTIGCWLINLFNEASEEDIDIKLQAHDSICCVCDDSESAINSVCTTLQRINMTKNVIDIEGEPLVIPLDFKVGYNFGDMKDYKLVA